jgi:hypothetical protein
MRARGPDPVPTSTATYASVASADLAMALGGVRKAPGAGLEQIRLSREWKSARAHS